MRLRIERHRPRSDGGLKGLIASGLPPVATFWMVFSVPRSTMLTLSSRPLLA